MSPVSSDTPVTTSNSENRTIERHSIFFLEPLFIQIENTLFQVPRIAFEGREGSPFADAASISTHSKADQQATSTLDIAPSLGEGRTEQNPIVLGGVSAVDFANLLHVMFAKPGPSVIPGSKDTISNDEWRSALRLSTMWNFTDIRQAAITALDHSMEDPLERIVIAREFHVRKWLVDAYEQLVLGDLKILEPSRCMEALGSQALARLLYARAEHGTFPRDTVRLAEHLNGGRSGLTYVCQNCGGMRTFGNEDHSSWCNTSVVVYGGQPQAGVPTGGSSNQLTNIIEKLFAEEFQQMG